MFRRLKIKQIASAADSGYVFVYGLGNDNRVYTWDSSAQRWIPHLIKEAKNEPVQV